MSRIEQVNSRKYNKKFFLNDDGTITLEAHVGHIHYKDGQGNFQDVDYSLVDQGTYWEMVKANYHLKVYKDFGANQLIRYENHFEGANHYITYDPKVLAWVNATDFSDYQVFRQAQAVQGVVSGNVIRYTNAFGNGIHFEITLLRSGFKKEIVIDAKNRLTNPPTASHKLVALFRYNHSGLSVKNRTNNEVWDGDSYLESETGYELNESDPFKASFIKPAYVEDSSFLKNRKSIKVFWKKHNNALWQAKVLPTAYLNNATYPVRADTTTTYYAGAGDGFNTQGDSTGWDAVHDNTNGGTSGQSIQVEGNDIYVLSYLDGSNCYIGRGFLPTDTSGLPDNAVVSSASMFLYARSKSNTDNDGDDWMNIVGQTTQASTSNIVAGDFDTCGAINNPTEGATRIDIGNVTTSAYNEFVLNSTGISWINKTGYSMFGIREGHDCLDSPVSSSGGYNQVIWGNADTAGTSEDPYLSVTYTATGSSPSSSVSPSPSASQSPSSSVSLSPSASQSPSSSASASESRSVSLSPSVSVSLSPSVSVSLSPSASQSPSSSASLSPSVSESRSPSSSQSPSSSVSLSPSLSPSASAGASESRSPSLSPSLSPSASQSPSSSPSSSQSPSASESRSPSVSVSASPSASQSPSSSESRSPSISPSASISRSPSSTGSSSPSLSPSLSLSSSVSASVSPSPSPPVYADKYSSSNSSYSAKYRSWIS